MTYDNKFYPGPVDEETSSITRYDTFFLFNDKSDFYDVLSTITSDDYKPIRPIPFGGSSESGFFREVTADMDQETIDNFDDFDEINNNKIKGKSEENKFHFTHKRIKTNY